jgi:toxin CcdB
LAQYDVHRLAGGLVLDCQHDLLAGLNTRVVVPLIPRDDAPTPANRFNPIFTIDGVDHVMNTQFAGADERRRLGEVVTALEDHAFQITDAFDILISGV